MASTDLIAPSASWISNPGISWVGRTIPAESASLIGSGWTQKVIALPDAPRLSWIDSGDGDYEVTVACDHGDDGWIDEVEFWLEGSTVAVSAQSVSARTNAIGFSVMIDESATTADGDAELYATIRPVNGYERLIGPISIHLNYNGGTLRPARYCDWDNGNNSWDGTSATFISGTTGPWKTIQQACLDAPDGALVKCAAGTYLEDSNAGGIPAMDKILTIKPADGVSLGEVIVDRTNRTSPAPYILWRRRNVSFESIYFQKARIDSFWGSYPGGVYNYISCSMIDSNGVTGPTTGYFVPDEAGQYLFRTNEGQWNHVQDCNIVNYIAAGASAVVNSTADISTDALFYGLGASSRDYTGVLGLAMTQTEEFKQRKHPDTSLTISTAVYSAPNTTLTFSGSPSLPATPETFDFLDGALSGQSFAVVSIDDGTDTIIVTGDASSASVSDTGWSYSIFHADSFQFAAGYDYENYLIQRYKAIGITSQPWLFQPGFTEEIKDIAIQVSIFDHTGAGPEISHWRDGHTHVVMRQITHIGTNTTFRADQIGFVLTDCVVKDSIWKTMNATGTFPVSGIEIDNNHFEEGIERGTNSDSGDVVFDADYYTESGLILTATPKIAYDYSLEPTGSGSLIGAISTAAAIASLTRSQSASNALLI